MPVVLTTNAPTRELYEKINAEANVDADPPVGLIVHAATETEDGIHVVDVWESQAHIDEFVNSRLGPAFAAAGAPTAPDLKISETFNLIRGS